MIDNTMALMHTTYSPQTIKAENSTDTRLKEQTDKFEAFFIKKVLDISLKTTINFLKKMLVTRYITQCITML